MYTRGGAHFGLLLCCDDPGAQQRLLDREVETDGVSWPIGVLPAWFETHIRIDGPGQGCVACWARSRRAERPREGWLTAGHVVPSHETIWLSDGSYGRVVDRGGVCVDAAIVSTTNPPVGMSRATPATAMVAGCLVELHDQDGRALQMTINGVDGALGASASQHLPLRFSLKGHGRPGDSGALVDDPANGEIAGLYLGQYVDYLRGETVFGIALEADYLTALMDMEVSR